MKQQQVRATIPAHLQSIFFEVGMQLNTDDPTIINTHILSCYFTGDRTVSASQPLQQALPETTPDDPFDGLVEWGDE